jgi:LysM repeat protein
MMKTFKYVVCIAILLGSVTSAQAQQVHKVKKQETIYGISRDYNITIDELMSANPEMKNADFKLKKGMKINIPAKAKEEAVKEQKLTNSSVSAAPKQVGDVRNRAIRLGVMLPLHDENGDGKRMTEYYRGVLMACDSLRELGISTDVYAWNLAENSDVSSVLSDPNAARCDIIIGPLYSKQVPELSKFVEKNDIMMVIPFSINAPDVHTNHKIFQVYQNQNEQNESTVRRFCEWFRDYHSVIIDCGDTTSTKGSFTSMLRRTLEQHGMKYSITNLKQSSDKAFKASFDVNKKNIVVLNTGRSPELLATFGRLSSIATENPDIHIALFGYTEWMMYVQHQL